MSRGGSQHDVSIPTFDELTLDPNGPPGNTWGLFGSSDQLGTLNFLTSDVVAAAAKDIKSGIRISLDLPLNEPGPLGYGRQDMKHEVRRRGEGERPVNDDLLHFNTQSSSQWDGFRHYGHLASKQYYGGYSDTDVRTSSALGIHSWAQSGGIVGRGVLLDFASYLAAHDMPWDHFSSSTIPLSILEELVTAHNITFRRGDILFIRTGFLAAHATLTDSEKAALAERPVATYAGVESSGAMLRWIWDNHFAAVAADCPAFESSPVGRSKHSNPETVLHQWLLAGWGMPIGELFDLERLAAHCRDAGRWTFFLSSMPLKIPGGVASPPNAVAIF